MRTLPLDRGTADRLLSGLVAPDDAPPGYAGVAGLLRSCARLAPPAHANEASTIVAMRERILAGRTADPSIIGRAAARRPFRLKLVAIGVGAMVVGSSGLAFAGELPAPAQRVAHSIFGSVGLDVPTPDDDAITQDDPDGAEGANAGSRPATTKGAVISAIAALHAGPGGAQGAAVSSVASDGHSQAGQPHGQSQQPHGRSHQPHGRSDQPHGHPGAAHPTHAS